MSNKPNYYSMSDNEKAAKIAAEEVEIYLRSLEETVDIINVEDDERFQKIDVDLVWITLDRKGNEKKIFVEIKGDRYTSGNYFFETISNEDKQSKGCVLYTKAHYIFYYFVKTKTLHRMPTKPTIRWFKDNMGIFEKKKVRTKVGNGEFYQSEGCLVPIPLLLHFNDKVKVKSLKKILKKHYEKKSKTVERTN